MKPNILLIMADQLRWDALGCNGNSLVDTPQVDRLAASGVNCAESYTPNPICVPARASLISGCYPHRCTGVKNNGGELRDGFRTMPAEFAAAGYRTYACGKLHYLPYTPPGESRVTHGFQVSEVAESGRALAKFDPQALQSGIEDYIDYLKTTDWAGYSRANGLGNNDVFAAASIVPPEHYVDAWVASRSLYHLDQHLASHSDQPFLMFSSFPKPHSAFDPPRPFDAYYDPRQMLDPVGSAELLAERGLSALASRPEEYEWDRLSPEASRTIKAFYYGLVTFQDQQVGRIVDFLEQRGLRPNTIVVYCADHGEMLGDFGHYFKEVMYEGSTKVPLMISWPGQLPAGERCDTLVGLQDLMPTLLSFADIAQVPDLDGRDIGDTLAGGAPMREHLVVQCHDAPRQQYMLRDRRWKYVYHEAGGVEELYDLAADPSELINLSSVGAEAEAARARADLRRALVAWCRDNGDTSMLADGDLVRSSPQQYFRQPPVQQSPFGRRCY